MWAVEVVENITCVTNSPLSAEIAETAIKLNAFRDMQRPAEYASVEVKHLQELMGSNSWEDCEQNQGKYNFNIKIHV